MTIIDQLVTGRVYRKDASVSAPERSKLSYFAAVGRFWREVNKASVIFSQQGWIFLARELLARPC